MTGNIVKATHREILKIGKMGLECFNLEDGRRVFHKKALGKALGLKSQGGSAFIRTTSRNNIGAELSEKTRQDIENPILFNWLGSDPKYHGYNVETLVDVIVAL